MPRLRSTNPTVVDQMALQRLRNIRLMVFDLGSTVCDNRSDLMVASMINTFRWAWGGKSPITRALISRDIGNNKAVHIKRLHAAMGLPCSDAKVKEMEAFFVEDHEKLLSTQLEPIEGAVTLFHRFDKLGIPVVYTTGYPRRLASAAVRRLGLHGMHFHHGVASDEVKEGRPAPFMIQANMTATKVIKPIHVAKVDDSYVGIKEALAAGALPIGVTETGTYRDRFSRQEVRAEFRKQGADLVYNSVADLLKVFS